MDEIYKEYSKTVYKYLLTLTNNTEIAEELMQETFYSAVKNIHQYRNEASLKTWLCKIAKNKWIDFYKKKQKNIEINIDEIDESNFITSSIEDEYSLKEDIISVYKLIHQLDNSSKEVVLLRIKANFSFKEIGTIMGKSEEWARITFYRAKIKLKEEFNNE